MQSATLPPWLSPWSSGFLYGQRRFKGALRERYRPRDRNRPRLTIYTYNHDDSHILRIGGWGRGESTNTVRPLIGWERYHIERDPWQLSVPVPPPPRDIVPDIVYPDVRKQSPSVGPGGAGTSPRGHAGAGAGAGGAGAEGWGAVRGWVAGTALLALFVLLARAAEKCIDKKFFKNRRRSTEWPTPTVYATSHQLNPNDLRGMDSTDLPMDTISLDLPPPYSECATTQNTAPKITDHIPEEPPPPYSDCYVEFSNKNGIPSVLIFSRRKNSIFNRHEIVGNRSDDEPSTSSAVDNPGAVSLEEIRAQNRAINGYNEGRDINHHNNDDNTNEANRNENNADNDRVQVI